jgi:hypothetical protein
MSLATPMLPAKDAAESFVIAFDFGPELAGATVAAATVACACVSGVDAAPEGMLSGSPAIDGAVLQLIAGGINGNTYKLRCVATLANGQRRVLAALLPVREA